MPGGPVEAPDRPLVVVEGEFDSLLLGQELVGLSTDVTLGSASVRLDVDLLGRFLDASPWLLATDSDAAGEKAAHRWPARTRRARPPGAFKDWTEAKDGSIDLRRWWADRLAGVESPELFTWPELAAQRWAGADASPGIVIPGPIPTAESGDPGKEAT